MVKLFELVFRQKIMMTTVFKTVFFFMAQKRGVCDGQRWPPYQKTGIGRAIDWPG